MSKQYQYCEICTVSMQFHKNLEALIMDLIPEIEHPEEATSVGDVIDVMIKHKMIMTGLQIIWDDPSTLEDMPDLLEKVKEYGVLTPDYNVHIRKIQSFNENVPIVEWDGKQQLVTNIEPMLKYRVIDELTPSN